MDHSDKARDDRKLDKAVEQTFPASDPIASKSVTSTEPPMSDPKRQAPIISSEAVEAAKPQTEECPRCHGTGRVVAASDGKDTVRDSLIDPHATEH